MATNGSKKVQARKWSNKPFNFPNHPFYAPEKLMQQWKIEGKSEEEIKQKLISYIQNERQKCVDNAEYFLNTYGFIVTGDNAGIIPFLIEDYQEELLESFKRDQYIIVNKSRQLGVSTILMFYALWIALFSQGKRILVVAHKGDSAEEFILKIKTAYEFLPDWLKPSATVYSKRTVEFETKSIIKAITSNPSAARSYSGTIILMDEAAFIERADEVVTGLMPTIASSNGKIIAISTPNGNSESNWFYNTFSHAKTKENGWKCFEIPWYKAKKYTKIPGFRENQIRLDNGNTDKFRREFECFPEGFGVLTPFGNTSIEDIKVGDLVLSHSGRTRKVTAIMEKDFSGNLIEFSSFGSGIPIQCTPEHPIRTYDPLLHKYSWVLAKDLTKEHLVVFPKINFSSNKIISYDLCMLLAWYITEGSAGKTQSCFSLSNNIEERDRVCGYLDSLKLKYSTRLTTGWQISLHDSVLSDFFKINCGSNAKEKRIPFSLISGFENEFFQELMMGDGCLHKQTYHYGTVSKSLAYQVQLLANSLNQNFAAGITVKQPYVGTIEGRTVNCNKLYSVQINIPKEEKARTNWMIRTKNCVAAKIKHIKQVPFTGKVYNFSVQCDESYIVEGRAVHNCVFDVNLDSLFSRQALNAFVPSEQILNKTFGGATYENTLFVWAPSVPGNKYIIGVDCAANKATSKDFSAFQVIDAETYEQVAEYIGKLPTEVFVDILIKTARHYNNSMLVIESNSYSEMVMYLLDQKRYVNIWYRDDGNPGFVTSKRTRPLLLEKLVLFYNNPYNASKLKSSRLKLQMENFSSTTMYADGSRKTEATKGNDDAVMALALAVVTLTPKEHVHRPQDNYDVATDTKLLGVGEYSQEYLNYHSGRMGISPSQLENRLKMFHAIKSGVYDGSGMEDLPLQHPVEEFDRQLSAKEFIGDQAALITDNPGNLLDNISMVPTDKRYTFSDIFDERLTTIMNMHQNFLNGYWRQN